MTKSSVAFSAGTRPSRLALIQTRSVISNLVRILPDCAFDIREISSPGDRDRSTDLRESPGDFFTRDLDDALASRDIDLAIHSAKDLPPALPSGLDWVWLPWSEDSRDAWVARKGETLAELPPDPIIGVSSERREAYTLQRFPHARMTPIRGNIEERLEQLDNGKFDLVLMAGCALQRLGLEDRITEWIPLNELTTPDGQGTLAMTFRKGDKRILHLRDLFIKQVCFVGAGVGSSSNCTMAGIEALGKADVCLYDSLMDPSLTKYIPPKAKAIYVGKRCGGGGKGQSNIIELIRTHTRRGERVVRLKGGDSGIFGRLMEEVDALNEDRIPYRCLPGVSSLTVATTGTGLLLTRRGVSRGFSVITPRSHGGELASIGQQARADLPVVFFMSASVVPEVIAELRDEGADPGTPAAMVFCAGRDDQEVVAGTLADIEARIERQNTPASPRAEDTSPVNPARPGIFIVGEVAVPLFKSSMGAFRGRKILLTCSSSLQKTASTVVNDAGGIPISFPLISLQAIDNVAPEALKVSEYTWVVLTSPSAVRIFDRLLADAEVDIRSLPRVISCGKGTSRELRRLHIIPELEPAMDFGAKGLLEAAADAIKPGDRILRLRSDVAGPDLSEELRKLGADVDDCVLYRNSMISYDCLPEFDDAIFASSSAVESFVSQWGTEALSGKGVAVIGIPTRRTLENYGIRPAAVGSRATVESCLAALAEATVRDAIMSDTERQQKF